MMDHKGWGGVVLALCMIVRSENGIFSNMGMETHKSFGMGSLGRKNSFVSFDCVLIFYSHLHVAGIKTKMSCAHAPHVVGIKEVCLFSYSTYLFNVHVMQAVLRFSPINSAASISIWKRMASLLSLLCFAL